MNRPGLPLLAISLFTLLGPLPAESAEPLARRWLYLQRNLQVKENAESSVELLRRAKKAGYNGVVLADYKLNILDRVPAHYFENAERVKRAAAELELEIIPCVAPFGYSDGLLAHDPNLAEGIPVNGTPLIVRGRTAELASTLGNALPGGGFEAHMNYLVPGWSFQDEPGKLSFVDSEVKHGGASSLRWEGSEGNARVSKLVTLEPWRQYHARVWIRTEGYQAAGQVRLFAMSTSGRVLSHSNLGVKPDQDWTEHHIVFNSLEEREVRIYCGTWGIRGGRLWMDDLALEETAFVNLLRREGCPLTVRSADGAVYEEGRDFERLIDPKMGNNPYAGSFDSWHEPPRLALTENSRIREGETPAVDFSHTVTIYDNQVACCLAHPKVFSLLEQQVRNVEKHFQPRTYFLSHDEIRVAGWCGSCRREGRSAGELLAENMRRCVEVIRSVNPKAELCVWSDMFDPHHNARSGFYLVNGDLAGSWEGLPPEMTLINWNHGAAAKSLPFFAERGHRQVLSGFYDGDPKSIGRWLETGRGLSGIEGAMYTTWRNDFTQLEAFAEAAWGAP